ncbi:uncharacterized protein LOC131929985 [Physella acuta]|uniref:uncharacterized protein LOC131929985 n=1 Tax=Physella acuta TaxID=109671 RepID=UPI0027DD287C|nr:uncharacterized protein LOC131929985 [Physella acuta]
MTSFKGCEKSLTVRYINVILLVTLLYQVCQSIDAVSFKINVPENLDSNVKMCQVDKAMAIDVCFDQHDNGEITLVNTDKMAALPEGTQCKLKQEGGSLTVVLCEDNDWRLKVLHGKSTQTMERRKRFLLGEVIFVVVIAVFLCIAFCNRNQTPQLNCKGIGNVTANQLETTAEVTWEEPTADDPEDGKLEPTQTNGNSSGSRFSEGSHTITYKATDLRGVNHYMSNVISCHSSPVSHGQHEPTGPRHHDMHACCSP